MPILSAVANAAPSPTPTYYSAIGGALTGLVLWALGTYAFKNGQVPGPVSGAVYIILPAVVAGVAGFFTRKEAKAEQAAADAVQPK